MICEPNRTRQGKPFSSCLSLLPKMRPFTAQALGSWHTKTFLLGQRIASPFLLTARFVVLAHTFLNVVLGAACGFVRHATRSIDTYPVDSLRDRQMLRVLRCDGRLCFSNSCVSGIASILSNEARMCMQNSFSRFQSLLYLVLFGRLKNICSAWLRIRSTVYDEILKCDRFLNRERHHLPISWCRTELLTSWAANLASTFRSALEQSSAGDLCTCKPVAPVAPVKPVSPVAPVAPVKPVSPVAPVAPVVPLASIPSVSG